ncbi:hypothetical protein RJG79_08440 [Mycoplasmatota bacterium WC44]
MKKPLSIALLVVSTLISLQACKKEIRYCPIEEHNLYQEEKWYNEDGYVLPLYYFAVDEDGRWYHRDSSDRVLRGRDYDYIGEVYIHYNEELPQELIEYFHLEDKLRVGN